MPLPLAGVTGRGLIAKLIRSFRTAKANLSKRGTAQVSKDLALGVRVTLPSSREIEDVLKLSRRKHLLTKESAKIVVRSIKASFKTGGKGTTRWKARKTPNLPGIIADLQNKAAPKPHRFTSRPVLVDSGKLRDSIDSRAQGGKIKIFTTKMYGQVHNEGGSVTMNITKNVHSTFPRLPQSLQTRFGWILNEQSLTFKIPKREFLTVSKDDIKKIEAQIVMQLKSGKK